MQFRRPIANLYILNRASNQQKLGISLTALSLALTEEKKKRRKWAKIWLIERRKFSHMTLLKELDGDDFRTYLSMDYNCFDELINLVSPLIIKQNTHLREAISAEERLVATLRYLASGREYNDLKFSTYYNFTTVTVKNNSRNMSCYFLSAEKFFKGKNNFFINKFTSFINNYL